MIFLLNQLIMCIFYPAYSKIYTYITADFFEEQWLHMPLNSSLPLNCYFMDKLSKTPCNYVDYVWFFIGFNTPPLEDSHTEVAVV